LSMLRKPLPNRKNIVISRTMQPAEGIDVCDSISAAIEKAGSYDTEAFVIGGGSIYKALLPLADKMYLSYVNEEFDGDTYFPELDESEWDIESQESCQEFDFVIYRRVKRK
jgi:dihydrofolate reductase